MANETLTGVKGFKVAALKAGIKASGNLDLGLIVVDGPCTAAALFSTNKIVSPTITVSKAHIKSGKARAVFINAGNANSCTGQRGLRDVHRICDQIAKSLNIKKEDVLVCSTGIIGQFLPMNKVQAGIKKGLSQLKPSAKAGRDLAKAILTTDTKPKSAFRQIRLNGKTVTLSGITKGSGMIAPNMATMLAFITTDIAISAPLLKRAIKETTNQTFNKLNIDRHNSTNDTALVLASGLAGNKTVSTQDASYQKFANALHDLCDDLTQQMALDAEGATCAITVKVTGAATAKDADQAVRAIVDSPLVRSAFHGADPNWGRIISAVGFSGAKFKAEKLSCKITDVFVYKNARPAKFNAANLSKKMKAKQWTVEVNLATGKHQDFCYTCDLSEEYITINADYHT
jgi:glutamate N-acetyltransferase/amino-acid N-acetyltransferase